MADESWYYARGNQQFGPVDKYTLLAKFEAGEISPDDLVWTSGMTEWRPAREAPPLHERVGGPAAAGGMPPPPPRYTPQAGQETPGTAIASLVLAALSWFTCGCLISLPAVILGHQALRQIDGDPGRYSGREIAIISLVIGYLNLVLTGLAVVFYLLLIALGVASELATL